MLHLEICLQPPLKGVLISLQSLYMYFCFIFEIGLLVTYDLSKSPGSRVVKVEVRCSICEVPDFAPLDPNEEYKVLMNNFLAEIGGDGYNMLRYNHTVRISGKLRASSLILVRCTMMFKDQSTCRQRAHFTLV